jgi:hypothetical protein
VPVAAFLNSDAIPVQKQNPAPESAGFVQFLLPIF